MQSWQFDSFMRHFAGDRLQIEMKGKWRARHKSRQCHGGARLRAATQTLPSWDKTRSTLERDGQCPVHRNAELTQNVCRGWPGVRLEWGLEPFRPQFLFFKCFQRCAQNCAISAAKAAPAAKLFAKAAPKANAKTKAKAKGKKAKPLFPELEAAHPWAVKKVRTNMNLPLAFTDLQYSGFLQSVDADAMVLCGQGLMKLPLDALELDSWKLSRGAKGLLHRHPNFLAFKIPGSLDVLTSICYCMYSTKHICGKQIQPFIFLYKEFLYSACTVYIYISTCMHANAYRHIHMQIRTQIHIYNHIQIYISICTYTNIHLHTFTYVERHPRTHTHAYMHT